MAGARITNEQIRRVLLKAHKHGLLEIQVGGGPARGKPSVGSVALAMGMRKATLSEYLYQHCRRLRWNPFKPETWKDNADTDTPLHERERQRYADQIERLREELRKAYRDANASDDLRAAIFGLAKAPVRAPTIRVPTRPAKGGIPAVPILFASDFQWGEVISSAQMDGVNEFNLAVARERYELLITKTIEICHHHVGAPRAKKIVYLRGGDMVSGDIHQELRETNAAMSVGQVVDLVENESAGIQALRSAFDEVIVISVPGNHGRTTVKPMSKGYAETNYDTLSAWMLEREFKADPAVKFYTPASGDALFDIYGWKFCLTHGDRMGSKGGMGFIGPAATIARGMKKNLDYWATQHIHIDYQLVGHYHTSLELELGFANGSLPGISEYARDFRAKPSRASQWLLFVHPTSGVTSRWPIYLSDPVKASGPTPAFQFLKAA